VFRESKIQHLHLSSRRDDDVLRLDVAMDDAGGVSLFKRLRRLHANVHHLGGRQRTLRDPLGQTLAVDVWHDDEDAVVFFADLVDRADVGMVQRRGGLGFVDQPLPGQLTTIPPL
jgi:hypothetical protein